MRTCVSRAVAAVVLVGIVAACASPAGAPGREPFPAGARFDYQVGAAYPPPGGVTLVVRDSTAPPAPGVYNVCYVNGFQTQPQERERWLAERRDLVLSGKDGQPVTDPGWPDELLLDTSTEAKRERIAAIVGDVIAGCARAGFAAVEIDNLDSYTRSHGALDVEDNLALAAELARRAHGHGVLIGQKNAAELGERGRTEAGFDFAVAEECVRWAECASYTDVYGDAVLDIEYTDDLAGPFAASCDRRDTPVSTILRDRDLAGPGEDGYAYEAC
ncbi:endo alpha-1,4 polygalactosaminidase [Prauserella flavalba]|uniref:endo alpha-1,4 polygalactosaminidase n=1 Tax=Prauserella flavalba TaxID=1477506 RepID=UPI000D75A272|nr:endo alpha-1,4 polygalactosaminidase [Prauserella flavalba]